jgi:hypothetical protein
MNTLRVATFVLQVLILVAVIVTHYLRMKDRRRR